MMISSIFFARVLDVDTVSMQESRIQACTGKPQIYLYATIKSAIYHCTHTSLRLHTYLRIYNLTRSFIRRRGIPPRIYPRVAVPSDETDPTKVSTHRNVASCQFRKCKMRRRVKNSLMILHF